MTDVTPEELERWQGMCEAATKGPWAVDAIMDDSETEIILGYEIPNAGSPIMLAATFDDDDEGPGRITPREGRDNARFIAESRTAMPKLVANTRRQDAEIARLREAIRTAELEFAWIAGMCPAATEEARAKAREVSAGLRRARAALSDTQRN